MGARLVFEAIVYIRAGWQWKTLPKERFGGASAVHRKFMQWSKPGFFQVLWKAGLAEYDNLKGSAWRGRASTRRC